LVAAAVQSHVTAAELLLAVTAHYLPAFPGMVIAKSLYLCS